MVVACPWTMYKMLLSIKYVRIVWMAHKGRLLQLSMGVLESWALKIVVGLLVLYIVTPTLVILITKQATKGYAIRCHWYTIAISNIDWK